MWWKKKEQEKEEPVEAKKEEDLLKELCGDDVQLYGVLRNQLLLNPLTSISEKDIDTLTEEAEKNGNFRQAIDKAIFEATQNPEEKERYTKVIQNLASKTIHATEQEKERAEKEGLTDRVNSLEKWIEQQKILSDRTEDIISVASEFYNEKLLVGGEDERRAARVLERQRIDREEWKLGEQEKAEREARKKEMKTMSKEERKEAEEREKREEIAAEERKAARAEEKRKAESEELSISEQEKRDKKTRRDERQRNI
jgi:hypothetical protein